jgi:HK97 gp10 family phage protein
MSLSVSGLAGVQAQLAAVGEEMAAKALASTLRTLFKAVVETARQLVPVDSGDLRDSLTLSVAKPKGNGLTVAVGLTIRGAPKKSKGGVKWTRKTELPPARRWHFVELGTIHMPAHPFARPALAANAQGMLDGLRSELAKKIQAAVRRKSRGK